VKQRISDLTSLRKLFYQLIQSDCVSFWRTLEAIKARSLGHSSWIIDKVGERLFELAKARVYRIKPSNGKSIGRLERVLEENPKERLVQQVLTEIQNRWDAKATSTDGPRSANVLLMVKDGYTLRSLQSFISLGRDLSMEDKWRRYLKIVNEKTKSIISSVNGGVDSLTEEQRLLFENDFSDKTIVDLNENLREQDRKRERKRRHDKITTERTRGVVDAETIRNRAQLDAVLEESKMDIIPGAVINNDLGDESDNSSSSSDPDCPELGYHVKPVEGLNLIIRTFDKLDDGEAELLLRDTMPSYVILYDSEPNFVRALEIYSNSVHAMDESADKLQVFFLVYESSAEESSFLQALDSEKRAFDRLIDHQRRMPSVLPTFNNFSTQEMQLANGGVGGSYAGGTMVRLLYFKVSISCFNKFV
jgi:DNA excision repair protein ERCC-4